MVDLFAGRPAAGTIDAAGAVGPRTKVRNVKSFVAGALLLALLHAHVAYAQDEGALAKQAQNPVASMVSLPFQNNFNFGVGPDDALQNNLNILPVVPFKLNKDWNLISRSVLPLIYQPAVAPGLGNVFGLGDIQEQLYLSPAKPGSFIWGAGPVLQFPTATDMALGAGKWAAGPGAVGLVIKGHWVVGALANNIWSYGGDGDRPNVNLLTVQPFINYNLPQGWYLTSSPIITANWEADSDNRWTVPIGGGVGKIFKIDAQPINAQLTSYYNVVRPDGGADWQIRLQIQLLFPK